MDYKTAAELRRQKILANAEARLRKIRRVTLDEVEKESDDQTSKPSLTLQEDIKEEENKGDNAAVPEIHDDFKEDENKEDNVAVPEIHSDCQINECINQAKKLTNGGLCNGSLNKSDKEEAVARLSPTNNNEINSGLNLEPIQNVSRMSTLSQTKRHLSLDLVIFIILGLLMRLLFSIGFTSIFLDNILGPFLVVCIPRVFVYIKQKPEVPLMYSIILVLGVNESRIKLPFRILSCIRTIVQYFAIYLFSFIVTHCILEELPL